MFMKYLKYINSFNLISEVSSSIESILDFDFDNISETLSDMFLERESKRYYFDIQDLGYFDESIYHITCFSNGKIYNEFQLGNDKLLGIKSIDDFYLVISNRLKSIEYFFESFANDIHDEVSDILAYSDDLSSEFIIDIIDLESIKKFYRSNIIYPNTFMKIDISKYNDSFSWGNFKYIIPRILDYVNSLNKNKNIPFKDLEFTTNLSVSGVTLVKNGIYLSNLPSDDQKIHNIKLWISIKGECL
jgi:hypothetical protein